MRKAILLVLIMSVVFVSGCGGQAASPDETKPGEAPPETASEPTQAPPRNAEEAASDEAKKRAAEQRVTAANSPSSFEVVGVTDGTTAYEGPQGAADVYVTNPQEDDMQALTDRLLVENSEYDMLTASFYQKGFPMSTETLIGVRYAFDSPVIEQKFASDLEGGMDELEGQMNDAIKDMCQGWTPEDVESLGPPPAEWNCEQYR